MVQRTEHAETFAPTAAFGETDRLFSLQVLFHGKWRLAILRQLLTGPTRLSQLKRSIPGCSKKVLIDTLHRLEKIGWVERKEYETKVKRVDYCLAQQHAADIRALVQAAVGSNPVASSGNSGRPPEQR